MDATTRNFRKPRTPRPPASEIPGSEGDCQATLRPQQLASASLTSEDLAALTAHDSDPGSDRGRRHRRLIEARAGLGWDQGFQERFTLSDVLGQGGSGDVFVASQRSLGREVAIKVGGIEGGVRARQFRAEAWITAFLEHPNIIPVYDAGDCYLAMKRIRGRSLHELVARDWPRLDYPALAEVLLQVANAVAFAHSRGVLHRDLKAANVMVGEFGEVLVLDWGLAARWSGGDGPSVQWDPETALFAGTPACMPPEIAGGAPGPEALHPALDVFCLGALLYHLLAGRLPFESETSAASLQLAARNQPQPVERCHPQAPPGLTALQCWAMRTDPSQRPTVAVWAEALRTWLRRSGNEPAACASRDEARALLGTARACPVRDWEKAFATFIRSVAAFDKALSLCPDLPGLAGERREAMDTFAQAALRAGSFQFARIVAQGHAIPPP